MDTPTGFTVHFLPPESPSSYEKAAAEARGMMSPDHTTPAIVPSDGFKDKSMCFGDSWAPTTPNSLPEADIGTACFGSYFTVPLHHGLDTPFPGLGNNTDPQWISYASCYPATTLPDYPYPAVGTSPPISPLQLAPEMCPPVHAMPVSPPISPVLDVTGGPLALPENYDSGQQDLYTVLFPTQNGEGPSLPTHRLDLVFNHQLNGTMSEISAAIKGKESPKATSPAKSPRSPLKSSKPSPRKRVGRADRPVPVRTDRGPSPSTTVRPPSLRTAPRKNPRRAAPARLGESPEDEKARTLHNRVERAYRQRLDAGFKELLEALPEEFFNRCNTATGGERKHSKVDVLATACRFILHMEEEVKKAQEELEKAEKLVEEREKKMGEDRCRL